MKRVNYHLPEQVIAKLKEEAERTGLSISEIIRRAIDAYLERK
jgi:Arc/MetJ-type ribon-helix-helix transcriptional regulator